MSQDLIALGLRRPPVQDAKAIARAVPAVPPDHATAALLDAALGLVRDLLAADEDDIRAALAQRFEACRAALADGATAAQLDDLSAGCLADGQQAVADLLAQRAERVREMASLVSMVREVIASVGSEMNTLHSDLQKSTDRFDAIGQMTDTRQIKARLVAEVMTLKQLTVSRQKAWQDTARGLGERIVTLEGQLVATQTEALTDPLTGIANRRTFERACAEWIRTPQPAFVLALIDVDEFKHVNDAHGHAAGDHVLVFIARTLGRSLRSHDVIARIGGDEFAVMARGLSIDQAERRLRAVIASLRDPAAADRPPVVPSVSCGIAECAGNDTMSSLFERADAGLYAAKRQGKNRIVVRIGGPKPGR
jgi:diguanylate cyclase (GGDEF)-like protein